MTTKSWQNIPEHVNYVRYSTNNWRDRLDGYRVRAMETGFGFSSRTNEDKVVGLCVLLDALEVENDKLLTTVARQAKLIEELEDKARQTDYAGAIKPKRKPKSK